MKILDFVQGGEPMLNGKRNNEGIGTSTHAYRFTDDLRAGHMSSRRSIWNSPAADAFRGT